MEETIIERIKAEHSELLFILKDVENCVTNQQRNEFFKSLKSNLIPHMKAEDETIYQKLRTEIVDRDTRLIIDKSDKEHHQLREYIQQLNLISIGSSNWIQVFKNFAQLAESHCLEEENDLFSEVKEDFSREELVLIGEEFEDAKRH